MQIYLTIRLPTLSLTTFTASVQSALQGLISVSAGSMHAQVVESCTILPVHGPDLSMQCREMHRQQPEQMHPSRACVRGSMSAPMHIQMHIWRILQFRSLVLGHLTRFGNVCRLVGTRQSSAGVLVDLRVTFMTSDLTAPAAAANFSNRMVIAPAAILPPQQFGSVTVTPTPSTPPPPARTG